MGGDIGVKAVVSIDPEDPTFGADVDVRRVNFAQLTKLYFDYDDSPRRRQRPFQIQRRLGQEGKMVGVGQSRVEDGHVFAIPVLGPLRTSSTRSSPAPASRLPRLATADFTMADEKINTETSEVQGADTASIGHGDIFFMKDKMDMSVRH